MKSPLVALLLAAIALGGCLDDPVPPEAPLSTESDAPEGAPEVPPLPTNETFEEVYAYSPLPGDPNDYATFPIKRGPARVGYLTAEWEAPEDGPEQLGISFWRSEPDGCRPVEVRGTGTSPFTLQIPGDLFVPAGYHYSASAWDPVFLSVREEGTPFDRIRVHFRLTVEYGPAAQPDSGEAPPSDGASAAAC